MTDPQDPDISNDSDISNDDVLVYFNPNCSKCRGARDLLDDKGVEADYFRYLDEAPSREELERVMGLLGIDDPRAMMRTGESVYKELGLADADRDALLDAMTKHPILIERPIVIRGDKAVIARPPDKLLDLF
jgi:arsenate reductase